jgi:hypothetical protein
MGTPERGSRRDPETDRLLEQELREAVGEEAAARAMEHADDVRAAHDARTRTPLDARGDVGAPRGTLTSWVTANGPLLAVSFAAVVVIGVILSLATGSWWAFVAALAVHAAGTLIVATAALRLTTETEHVSPALAARLEAEGVQDPDRAFTELTAGAAGPGDVVRDGRNAGDAQPEQDPAAAANQQRTAWTPSSDATKPVGPGKSESG